MNKYDLEVGDIILLHLGRKEIQVTYLAENHWDGVYVESGCRASKGGTLRPYTHIKSIVKKLNPPPVQKEKKEMKYSFGEWQIWNGGKCPEFADQLVQVQMSYETRETALSGDVVKAGDYRWDFGDIIAYRLAFELGIRDVYVNVYKDNGGLYCSYAWPNRDEADKGAGPLRVACQKIILVEGQYDD